MQDREARAGQGANQAEQEAQHGLPIDFAGRTLKPPDEGQRYAGGSHSSTRFPSGSVIQPNRP